MAGGSAQSSRESVRARLVDVATQLLATSGPDAVTTRSVALAAGVQAPSIYRLFGDKNGLLEAVAEHGFATYLQQPPVDVHDDPVEDLRSGWDLHIGFGLDNPALFRLMHTSMQTPEGRRIAESGAGVLAQRVHRVARAGRLRVAEHRAVELIRAAGTGVVFTLIDRSEEDRSLANLAWEAVSATILIDARDAPPVGTVAAAVALTAALPDLPAFTSGERALLQEWLARAADLGPLLPCAASVLD